MICNIFFFIKRLKINLTVIIIVIVIIMLHSYIFFYLVSNNTKKEKDTIMNYKKITGKFYQGHIHILHKL